MTGEGRSKFHNLNTQQDTNQKDNNQMNNQFIGPILSIDNDITTTNNEFLSQFHQTTPNSPSNSTFDKSSDLIDLEESDNDMHQTIPPLNPSQQTSRSRDRTRTTTVPKRQNRSGSRSKSRSRSFQRKSDRSPLPPAPRLRIQSNSTDPPSSITPTVQPKPSNSTWNFFNF